MDSHGSCNDKSYNGKSCKDKLCKDKRTKSSCIISSFYNHIKRLMDPSSCRGKHKPKTTISSDHFLDLIGDKNIHKKEITHVCDFFPDPRTTLAPVYVMVKRLPKHAKLVSFREDTTIIPFPAYKHVHFSNTVVVRTIPAREEPEEGHLIHGLCKYDVDVLKMTNMKQFQSNIEYHTTSKQLRLLPDESNIEYRPGFV